MTNNTNGLGSFSRGLFVALALLAIFCGIAALGAAFNTIPWLLLAGGICILLILGVIIWFLGYFSRKVEPDYGYDIDDIEPEDDESEDVHSVQVFKNPNPPSVKIVEDKSQEAAALQKAVTEEQQHEEGVKPKPATQTQKQVAQPQEPAAPKKNVAGSKQKSRRDISHFDMFPEDSKK